MKRISLLMLVTAFAIAIACTSGRTNGGNAPSSAEVAPDAVATGFVEAFGAFDADAIATYLADDADIGDLVGALGGGGLGTPEELSLMIGFLEGAGYEQILHGCGDDTSSAGRTIVRCTFDFHLIRSSEIGLGPYEGSYFDLTVADGQIVGADLSFETGVFSTEMWEPFAAWVSDEFPNDAAVMYHDPNMTGVRLSEGSVALWERRSHGYVRHVNHGGTAG